MNNSEVNNLNQDFIRSKVSNQQRDNIANVLIVDNDPAVARFMLEIFARRGIRANLAEDAEAARDFLPQQFRTAK